MSRLPGGGRAGAVPPGEGAGTGSGLRGAAVRSEDASAALPVSRVRALLPEVESLRPLVEHLFRTATPDPLARWAGSGEVGTLADRLVDPTRLERELPALIESLQDEALRTLRLAVEALAREARGDGEGAATLLAREAEGRAAAGRGREAEAWAESALEAAERVRDRTRVRSVYLAVARVARIRGRLDRAAWGYREARKLAGRGGDPALALTATIGLGNLEVDRGRWTAAEGWYAEADVLLEEVEALGWDPSSGPPPAPRPERWHLALNRSILAREEGALDRAWHLLLEADHLAGALGDVGARAIVENARGQILLAMGEPEAAEVALRRGLAAATHADARVTIGVNLAEARLAAGFPLAAGETARDAEAEALRAGVVARLPEVYRVLGQVLAALESPEAFVLFERALDLVEELALPAVERARVLEAWAAVEESAALKDEEAQKRARARATEARRIRAGLRGEDPRRDDRQGEGAGGAEGT